MRLAVTTPADPSSAEAAAADEAAARHGLAHAARGRRPLREVAADAGAEGLLVLSARGAILWTPEGERTWAPGMGFLRLKRSLAAARKGPDRPTERDPMLEAAGIRPGDAVLDATLGLGADALVAAGACGPDGRVVACEASAALAAWVAEGLRRLPVEAAGRVEVRGSDHAALLATLPGGSFDVVLFDPMFRAPSASAPLFALVRACADPRPLAPEALLEARRVACRGVLVKDEWRGRELLRLGLRPLPSRRMPRILFGWADALGD